MATFNPEKLRQKTMPNLVQPHVASPGLESCQAALALIERRWNEAGQKWSLDAFASIYTEDALFFGGRPGLFAGIDQIKEYYRSYVGVVISAAIKYRDQNFIELAPGMLLAQGFADFDFTVASGDSGHTRLRSTNILVMRNGDWKVLQHHFSEPINEPPIQTIKHAAASA
jgi:ketosteroid isomerase-like protein